MLRVILTSTPSGSAKRWGWWGRGALLVIFNSAVGLLPIKEIGEEQNVEISQT